MQHLFDLVVGDEEAARGRLGDDQSSGHPLDNRLEAALLLLQIREEPRVLQGDGRLSGEQANELQAIGAEGGARKIVLEIDDAGEATLVANGRSERGERGRA